MKFNIKYMLYISVWFSSSALSTSYNFIQINDLAGGISSTRGYGINNSGQVVGVSSTTQGERAFYWANGAIQNLGTLPGGSSVNNNDDGSRALAINDSGQVVGWSVYNQGNETNGYLWEDGVLTDLGQREALGINNSGQIVGWGSNGVGSVIWNNGSSVEIGDGYARDINDNGQVTGTSLLTGQTAYLWENGQRTLLGGLDGSPSSDAFAINNSGNIVGDSSGEAFYWSSGSMQSLDPFGLVNSSSAWDINDSNFIVGSAFANNNEFAYLWQDSTGMIDLNTLIDPSLGCTLTEARSINNNGQIVANGFCGTSLGYSSFLLNPVPIPPSLFLFITGLVTLFHFKRKTSA